MNYLRNRPKGAIALHVSDTGIGSVDELIRSIILAEDRFLKTKRERWTTFEYSAYVTDTVAMRFMMNKVDQVLGDFDLSLHDSGTVAMRQLVS